MTPLRLRFRKTGSIRYISHLDLSRAFSRALVRAGVGLWYTEGFNPHPFLVFGPPLSVGYVGEREILDIRLVSDEKPQDIRDRLSRTLPRGLEVTEIYTGGRPLKELARAAYSVYMEGGPQLLDALARLWERDRVTALKKSKSRSGFAEVDITRYIRALRPSPSEDGYRAELCLPCSQSENINPALLLGAVEREAGTPFDYTLITRTDFLDAEGEPFF